MNDQNWLAERFEANRSHLRGVAYRMLGSLTEADDAVQEAAGHATIILRGRAEEVTATELDPTQRVDFFRDVLGPLARGIPLGVAFIRVVDGVDVRRPIEAAEGRPVFELHAVR